MFHYSPLKYVDAVKKWIQAGKPVRSEEEVSHIFNNICKQCEYYNEKRGNCSKCTCRVNLSQTAPLNKIKMATEHCPIGKW